MNIYTVLKKNPGWREEYVENLYKSLRKNITTNFNFYCITDAKNINGVDTIKLISLPDNCFGYWNKLQIFKESINRPSLFFDLDTIVKGNLDSFLNDIQHEKFLMVRSPFRRPHHSSCIMFWNGDYSFLWNNYLNNFKIYNEKYAPKPNFQNYGDQAYIAEKLQEYKLFQDILSEPEQISRMKKKESSKNEKILICNSNTRAPWKNLNHPDVTKHWMS